MEKLCNFVTILLLFLGLLRHGGTVTTFKSQDRSEEWGYLQVKPKAHMFWWLCRSPYRVEDPSKPWPIILWLQGGPIEVNEDNSAPLYKFLKAGKWGIFGDEIQWNFTKFLVDKDGQVVGHYYPTTILWKQ